MPFLIFFAVLLVLLVTAFLILRWCYGQAFYQPNGKKYLDPYTFPPSPTSAFCKAPMHRLIDELKACPYEEVTILSHDGLRLYGQFYRFSDQNRLEILFHGWRSNGLRDSCGGAKMARDAGYNLLIVDQRAHGKSEGNALSFGILEKYDCLSWVNYAVERFGADVRILLGGVSMGASTVLMASALELPPQVRGITADCGYSSPEAILRKVCRDRGIPDRLGYPFLAMSARLFGGFRLDPKDSAVEAVRHAKVPVMIMHGEADEFVPFEMCHEIFDACAAPEKELVTIPNAEHGMSYFFDTETYSRRVVAFKVRALES